MLGLACNCLLSYDQAVPNTHHSRAKNITPLPALAPALNVAVGWLTKGLLCWTKHCLARSGACLLYMLPSVPVAHKRRATWAWLLPPLNFVLGRLTLEWLSFFLCSFLLVVFFLFFLASFYPCLLLSGSLLIFELIPGLFVFSWSLCFLIPLPALGPLPKDAGRIWYTTGLDLTKQDGRGFRPCWRNTTAPSTHPPNSRPAKCTTTRTIWTWE